MHRLFVSLALLLSLSACQSHKQELAQNKNLILRVEERKISDDIVTEYRIFDSGLINKTTLYSSDAARPSFASDFAQLKISKLELLKQQIQELRELEYRNYFPWKEDFYKRGDVIKFELLGSNNLTKTLYYYTGDAQAPKILGQLYKQLQN